MKKIITSLALIGCFLMVATTNVSAQDKIKNNTPCKFLVKVAWGKLGPCSVGGFETVVVAPYSVVTVPNVSPYEILYAKGYPTSASPGSNCVFYIAQGCAPYPISDTLSDPDCCDGYTASMIPGYGIYITN